MRLLIIKTCGWCTILRQGHSLGWEIGILISYLKVKSVPWNSFTSNLACFKLQIMRILLESISGNQHNGSVSDNTAHQHSFRSELQYHA